MPEQLAERVFCTKSQFSLLDIYFLLNLFFSFPLLLFRYLPNTCSHHTKVWQGTYPTERFRMASRWPYWCSKTMKRRPCWCPKPVLWELNSFLVETLSFVPINLYRCWSRERKRSISGAPISRSARRSFAPLLKSPRNHRPI